jgi:uncharacterized protein (TIGR02757 family)
MEKSSMKVQLEKLYGRYNRFELIHPDPLEFLHHYPESGDREVVALIASALAYGRVGQILKSVASVLGIMGPSPLAYLQCTGSARMSGDFSEFVHRFARGHHVVAMLAGIQGILAREGSLQACFMAGYRPAHETVLPALTHLVHRLTDQGRLAAGHLVADPLRKSACKRLNLFLRWLVRCDEVDPGGWERVPAAKLIVPLDVHMHRICRSLGLTQRRHADLRTALEVTEGFRRMVPDDPVRYDFALTRLGIRDDADLETFLSTLPVWRPSESLESS